MNIEELNQLRDIVAEREAYLLKLKLLAKKRQLFLVMGKRTKYRPFGKVKNENN